VLGHINSPSERPKALTENDHNMSRCGNLITKAELLNHSDSTSLPAFALA
jgi:hypothetical protein